MENVGVKRERGRKLRAQSRQRGREKGGKKGGNTRGHEYRIAGGGEVKV